LQEIVIEGMMQGEVIAKEVIAEVEAAREITGAEALIAATAKEARPGGIAVQLEGIVVL
jgi:hypothetical protein